MAGIVFQDDIEDLEPRVFIEEILGLQRNQYNLRNLCSVVQTPKLQARVRTATKGTVDTKVGEGEEADIASNTYSYTDLALWKNVGHVSVTDEARKRASFDVLNTEINNVSRDLGRAENAQIATEWGDNGTSTASTAGVWTTDSNDPAEDVLDTVVATMLALDKGYDPKDLAMHPQVYAALVHNDNISKEVTHTALIQKGGVDSIFGMNITVDINLTDTRCYVLDKEAPACILAQGGTSAAKYRNEPTGEDRYIVRQWLQPKVVLTDALYYLTGVHS
jgi:HK97 family phage major capsid protein